MIRLAAAVALAATMLGGCLANDVREVTARRAPTDSGRTYVVIGLRPGGHAYFRQADALDGGSQPAACGTDNRIEINPIRGQRRTRFFLFDVPWGAYIVEPIPAPDAVQGYRADRGETNFFGVFPAPADDAQRAADLADAEAFAQARGLGGVDAAETTPRLPAAFNGRCTP